jgi:3-oxoacyl-[acyl-carrier-protein] synthase-3
MPASKESVAGRMHYIKMNGNEVFKFAVRIMEEASREVARRAGIGLEEVALFIPHQANIRIIDSAARRLKIPQEKIFVNVHKYGNTSSASIPIALDEAYREGRIKDGDLLLLVGFGAGLTWGSTVIRW